MRGIEHKGEETTEKATKRCSRQGQKMAYGVRDKAQ
jgi:hypothetical protein